MVPSAKLAIKSGTEADTLLIMRNHLVFHHLLYMLKKRAITWLYQLS